MAGTARRGSQLLLFVFLFGLGEVASYIFDLAPAWIGWSVHTVERGERRSLNPAEGGRYVVSLGCCCCFFRLLPLSDMLFEACSQPRQSDDAVVSTSYLSRSVTFVPQLLTFVQVKFEALLACEIRIESHRLEPIRCHVHLRPHADSRTGVTAMNH